MDKKKIRAKHFSFKELRFSIAYMVLWSLLTVAFFTYLAIELGEKVENRPLYFILVLAGYASIVIFLTLIFTHRLIGPFERLKVELKIILSGEYHRRLCTRTKDDLYISSFILEVNKLIDHLEKMYNCNEGFRKKIDSDLSNIHSILEKKETSKEELREAIISSLKKVEGLVNDNQGDRQ
ncbi:MAG: hypothetical protein V3R54_08450 [Thermodesulfovibrionia bacterium]